MSVDVLPLTKIDTSGSSSNPEPSSLFNQNDMIIFDELKQLILQGDWENLFVKLVEYQFPINFKESEHDGYTLLHYAASNRKLECLRLLLVEFLADPNIKTDNGFAPIHLLVSSDCRCPPCSDIILNCLQILMESGANVDEEDGFGETALYEAARNRLCKVSDFLLSNGSNINHWVNGTSVATLLAQYVPDVLKLQFDKYITIDAKKGAYRSLRLDFRLLLQEIAVEEGLPMNPPVSPSPFRQKRIFTHGRAQVSKSGSQKKAKRKEQNEKGENDRFLFDNKDVNSTSCSSSLSSTSTSSSVSSSVIPPKETELLNYLLRADLAASEVVVNHPLVEAFVHLKWLTVRNLFFLLRSVYLFLISLYTFYVFDTFVNATCFYHSSNSTTIISPNGLPAISGVQDQMEITARKDDDNDGVEQTAKATFGFFFPKGNRNGSEKEYSFYQWHSFSEYFKAHEMTCEPSLRTQIMAYIISAYGIAVVLYELYKCFESWYDYFKSPLNFAWWLLAVNIGVTVLPGLNLYAHSWQYAYAAFSLVYGWILVLAQFWRLPNLGGLVGVFVKVLKEFIILLFTFSPVLLAFALGFSVLLPQHEFFRFLPTAFFKVFLMMTGDVDFWGVFAGTWSTAEYQGHVYIPLFIIYSLYILTVTMVLMSLLMGLAVDNIQEVRREAALYRTVRLIQEIGIFESILHKPAIYYCGFSKYFRRLFSITSLCDMNGPELVIFPEDPDDTKLPIEIKKKLVPYLISSCCCTDPQDSHHDLSDMKHKIGKRKVRLSLNTIENRRKQRGSGQVVENSSISFNHDMFAEKQAAYKNSKDALRKEFFEGTTPATAAVPTSNVVCNCTTESHQLRNRELLTRDLQIYQELKLLLEDNEKLNNRLETLKRKLIAGK